MSRDSLYVVGYRRGGVRNYYHTTLVADNGRYEVCWTQDRQSACRMTQTTADEWLAWMEYMGDVAFMEPGGE